MITASDVSELLSYNPDTGVFRWKISRRGASAGTVAGAICSGYRYIGINKGKYKAARIAFLIMEGRWPKNQIDHIDHCQLNDKWSNLREVTVQENSRNRSISPKNTSGVTGVYWDKSSSKWRGAIRVSGQLINLGSFTSKREAAAARKGAEKKYKFHKNHGRS